MRAAATCLPLLFLLLCSCGHPFDLDDVEIDHARLHDLYIAEGGDILGGVYGRAWLSADPVDGSESLRHEVELIGGSFGMGVGGSLADGRPLGNTGDNYGDDRTAIPLLLGEASPPVMLSELFGDYDGVDAGLTALIGVKYFEFNNDRGITWRLVMVTKGAEISLTAQQVQLRLVEDALPRIAWPPDEGRALSP